MPAALSVELSVVLVSKCSGVRVLKHVLTTSDDRLPASRDNESHTKSVCVLKGRKSMFRNFVAVFMLGVYACANVWAKDERPPHEQGGGREMANERRDRPRDQREEFRAMREQLRDQYRQETERPGVKRDPREEDDRSQRGSGLRRLEPEDRERLRRAMRDAAREHYGR